MTTEPTPSPNAARLERTYDASAEIIWELWTTAAGLEEWLVPDGFETRVSEVELRPGGQLRYTMTATAPEQVAFVRNLGMPLSNEFCKTFTEIASPTRLAYLSLIDFVPDTEPYEHLTTIDIEPAGDRTNLVMTLDPLHDGNLDAGVPRPSRQRARQPRGGDQATRDVIADARADGRDAAAQPVRDTGAVRRLKCRSAQALRSEESARNNSPLTDQGAAATGCHGRARRVAARRPPRR